MNIIGGVIYANNGGRYKITQAENVTITNVAIDALAPTEAITLEGVRTATLSNNHLRTGTGPVVAFLKNYVQKFGDTDAANDLFIQTTGITENGQARTSPGGLTGPTPWTNPTIDGSDNLIGTAGGDTFAAGKGDDTVSGLGGNDRIYGGDGNDIIFGGDGDDTMVGGYGANTLNGGLGSDTATYDGKTSGTAKLTIYADLTTGVIYGKNTFGANVTTDTVVSIENVIGSGNSDTLIGDQFGNKLDGASANDTITGNDGNDSLIGGDGYNSLYGGNGNDVLDGYLGESGPIGTYADTLAGGAGDDVYLVNTNNDVITEAFSGGIDEIQAIAAAYDLTARANVENLAYLGSLAFAGMGNTPTT